VESLREAMDEEEQRDDEHDEDEEKARGWRHDGMRWQEADIELPWDVHFGLLRVLVITINFPREV
jgi:hypothetical protein